MACIKKQPTTETKGQFEDSNEVEKVWNVEIPSIIDLLMWGRRRRR